MKTNVYVLICLCTSQHMVHLEIITLELKANVLLWLISSGQRKQIVFLIDSCNFIFVLDIEPRFELLAEMSF